MNKQNFSIPRVIPLTVLGCSFAALIAGCSKHEQVAAAPEATPSSTPPTASAFPHVSPAITAKAEPIAPPIDAASLLQSEELQSLQGEPLSEVKPSVKSEGGFAVSQCLFVLPTYSKSIVVTVTQRGTGPNARDPAEFWRESFHEKKDRDEEERGQPPAQVGGVGDESYWTSDRVGGGVLYVLKGNTMLRIGIGSVGDDKSRLEKTKAIAELVLKRL